MRNSFKYLIVLMFAGLSAHCSGFSTSYYFCSQPGYSLSKMFSIQTNAHGRRLIRDPYHDRIHEREIFLGHHDEKTKTIAIYKQEFNTYGEPSVLYVLWNFDISSNILYYDLVNDISPKTFQDWTRLSPIPENIKKWNVKPELLKYISAKKLAPSNIFMTKTKWIFNCQSMSYLRYQVQRAFYILYDTLASMG